MPEYTWNLVVVARDTLVAGLAGRWIEHRAEVASGATFVTLELLHAGGRGTREVRVAVNKGDGSKAYRIEVRDGNLTALDLGSSNPQPIVDETVPPGIIHDEMLPFVAATADLRDGDTLSIPVFSFNGVVFRQMSFRASVRAAVHARSPGLSPEPVWVLTGDATYPATVTVARADRAVLHAVIPRGTIGVETMTYLGTPGAMQ
jgi:hypothetical protein